MNSADTTPLDPSVAKLLKDIRLVNGKLEMSRTAFEGWRRAHRLLSPHQRNTRGPQLLALALRLEREGRASSVDAVAQLYVLAAELMGNDEAVSSFESVPARRRP